MSKILNYTIILVRSTYNYYSLLALKFIFFVSSLKGWFSDSDKDLLSNLKINVVKRKLSKGGTIFIFLFRLLNLLLLVSVGSLILTILSSYLYFMTSNINFVAKDVIITEMIMRDLDGNYTKKLRYIKTMSLYSHFHWYLLNSSVITGSFTYFILNILDLFSVASLIRYGESLNFYPRALIFTHQHAADYIPKTICIYTFLVNVYNLIISVPKHINYILLSLQILAIFVESIRIISYLRFIKLNSSLNTTSVLVVLIFLKSLFNNIYLNLKYFSVLFYNKRKSLNFILNNKKYLFRFSLHLYNFCILKNIELSKLFYQWKPTSKRTPYFKSIKK